MVNTTAWKGEQIAVDVLNVLAGALLFSSPWLFAYASEPAAAWNACIFGGLFALVATGALVMFKVGRSGPTSSSAFGR
jgi:hypothetical protein